MYLTVTKAPIGDNVMQIFHKWLGNIGYTQEEIDKMDKNTYLILLEEFETLVEEMTESKR